MCFADEEAGDGGRGGATALGLGILLFMTIKRRGRGVEATGFFDGLGVGEARVELRKWGF